jgi:hypothetical protein
MLVKVISGGQNGVDQAGLQAAATVGIKTGGHAPKGYRTQDGPNLLLKALYGLEETPEPGYPPRTRLNVLNSDGTLQIAKDYNSAGEQLTTRLLLNNKKPRLPLHPALNPSIDEVVAWLIQRKISVLNVAGNSLKTWPDAFDWAYPFLVEVFRKVNA